MILLIFGAGASYGSESDENKEIVPPLGYQLFEKLNSLNGSFSRLTDKQKGVFRKGGFERGMATIANNSTIINPLQKELACYISKFEITKHKPKHNAYVMLFKGLKEELKSNKIRIATLNYDLLIEKALQHIYKYKLDNIGKKIIKVHGSCSFLPDLGDMVISDVKVEFTGDNSSLADGLKFIEPYPISYDEISNWCKNPQNDCISPVMAMYQEGKRFYINKTFMEEMKKAYTESVEKSSRIVIIGTKYVPHDEHIWKPIKESKAHLLFVDPSPDPEFIEKLQELGLTVDCTNKGFKESIECVVKFVKEV